MKCLDGTDSKFRFQNTSRLLEQISATKRYGTFLGHPVYHLVYVPSSAGSQHHHSESFLPTRYQLRCLMSNDSTYCSAGPISVLFLFCASGNLTAKQVWVVCLVSRMKSRTALVTIAGLVHFSEAIKKPYVETYWESWIPGVSPQICPTKKPIYVFIDALAEDLKKKYRFNCFNFSGLPK